MENHTTTEGDAHGLSPEPAGSKPIDGESQCRRCNDTGIVSWETDKGTESGPCGKCQGIGAGQCDMCDGRGYIDVHYNAEPDTQDCPQCGSTGPEPSVATRPGSSLFSPPAPPQQLEGRRAAFSDDEKRLVEAFKQLQAAKAAVYAPTAKYFELNYAAERALHEAACTLAQSLLERAEGGLNIKGS